MIKKDNADVLKTHGDNKKILTSIYIMNLQTLKKNLWIHTIGIKKIRFISCNYEKNFYYRRCWFYRI